MRSERRRRPRCALGALLAAAALWLGPLPSAARAEELVVVLNEKNPSNAVSLQQLRLIYGGYKRTWPDGAAIQLLLPASGSAAMGAMVTRVFKRQSEEEVAQYYVDLVFQQKLVRPPAQLPIQESLARVRSQPGAIVVVGESDVGDPRGLRLLPLKGP